VTVAWFGLGKRIIDAFGARGTQPEPGPGWPQRAGQQAGRTVSITAPAGRVRGRFRPCLWPAQPS